MRSRYLDKLEQTLRAGLQLLPRRLVQNTVSFTLGKQCPGGGFADRSGQPDIYYTAFALRLLALHADFDCELIRPTLRWLESLDIAQFSTLANLYSYIQSLAIAISLGTPALAEKWEKARSGLIYALLEHRTENGAFAARRGASSASVYHTFLGLLGCELLDIPCDSTPNLSRWLQGRQNADGGFADIETIRTSSTNPTAAAVAIWKMIGAACDIGPARVLNFMRKVYIPHFGFAAHPRMPVPDLLSTFTALWTLYTLGHTDFVAPDSLTAQVSHLQDHDGGFLAGPAELLELAPDSQDNDRPGSDVEYTFYGLATLALLQVIRKANLESHQEHSYGDN